MMKMLIILFTMFLCGSALAGHPNAAIYHSALKGDICGIARSISSGGTVNQQYPFTRGRTPLMAAIISGDWNTVNFLLRFGSDPHIKNKDKKSSEYGWSALQYAVNFKKNDKAKQEERVKGNTILNLIVSTMNK